MKKYDTETAARIAELEAELSEARADLETRGQQLSEERARMLKLQDVLALEVKERQEANRRLEAMTKDRDAQAGAVRVLAMGVLAGQMARACLRGCPSTSGGAGGQTIGEGLSRMRFHQVPLSIFDHLYGAEEMIHDNPIAAAAVKGGEG